MRLIPSACDARLLVGPNTLDDAAVYLLREGLALVQTVDFFTPVVDDPYSFGTIAVANALSDVYAMGGTPLTALNIVAFPSRQLSLEILVEILKGGAAKAEEAGVCIVGGHTIDDPEPKYGLAVTGLVDPQRVVTNSGAKAGCLLVLTKPLGIGIITTAIKRRLASAQLIAEVTRVMAALNRGAAEAMLEVGVDACTDVTGFGLLGHLWELTRASGVGARVYLNKVPVMGEAWGLVREGVVPGGTRANHQFLQEGVIWEDISPEEQLLLCDAQTSGGLLIAVPPEKSGQLLQGLRREEALAVAVIGEITSDDPPHIRVKR